MLKNIQAIKNIITFAASKITGQYGYLNAKCLTQKDLCVKFYKKNFLAEK
jgi:hypothetical protein